MSKKAKIIIASIALGFLLLVTIIANSGSSTQVDENGNPISTGEVQNP